MNSTPYQSGPRVSVRSRARVIARVAMPVPVRRCFDFLAPYGTDGLQPGIRVRVPFGRRHLTGVVMATSDRSDIPAERLREIEQVLDVDPVFPPPLFEWLCWVARYYHHPIGEVLSAALPAPIRAGQPVDPERPLVYRLTAEGEAADP